MKHSKDFKLIILLFAFELVIVTVLTIIAVAKYGGGSGRSSGGQTLLLDNVGEKLFPDSGRLNVGQNVEKITPDPNENKTSAPSDNSPAPTQAPTPVPEKYNYYSFVFDENGYRSVSLGSDDSNSTVPGNTIENIKESKLIIPASKSYLSLGNINIENNYVGKDLKLTDIFAEPLKLKQMKRDAANQFIVFYTHTYEGYCLTEEEQLHEKRWYTTENNESNVVAAGTALYEKLVSKGFNGVNNLTVHNDGYDALHSYDFSLVTLQEEFNVNPDALLSIDVHRNGYGSLYHGKLYGPTAELDEEKYAKIMFVIGLDYSSETGTYSFETERVPGITSGIALRRTPYNQQVAPNALLAEVGFEGNLVSEAQRTTSLLADIIAELYS